MFKGLIQKLQYNRRVIFYIWMTAVILSAFNIYGAYFSSEYSKTITPLLAKISVTDKIEPSAGFLNRETSYVAPFTYLMVTEPVIKFFGYNHFFIERYLHIFMALAVLVLFHFFLKVAFENRYTGLNQSLPVPFLLYLASLWFVPGMLVRHSVEALSSLAIILSLGFLKKFTTDFDDSRSGFLAGFLAMLTLYYNEATFSYLLALNTLMLIYVIKKRISLTSFIYLFSGEVVMFFTGVLIDSWGYNELTFTVINRLQGLLHTETLLSYSFYSAWQFFIEIIVYMLQPLIHVFILIAIFITRKDFFSQILSGTILSSIFFSGFYGEDEVYRYFPVLFVLILLLIQMLKMTVYNPAKKISRLIYNRNLWMFSAFAGVIVFIVFTTFAPVRDKYRIPLGLNSLEEGSMVFTSADIFGVFDGTPDQVIKQRKLFLPRYAKPEHVYLYHSETENYNNYCRVNRHAYLLLTRFDKPTTKIKQRYNLTGDTHKTLADMPIPAISKFPFFLNFPEKEWYRRMHRLVTCESFLAFRSHRSG